MAKLILKFVAPTQKATADKPHEDHRNHSGTLCFDSFSS